ncbi:hypothetical protein CVT24_001415 [Panaeolus cyanescens]|uniref:Protein phosphatase n=1 Tax=Panaeolus cyanescens TaxID=181874 RepID=A0A409W3I0_9AGAR|nr:hypothetical protein CVT24_001415 [Panaeolus cyanescens]
MKRLSLYSSVLPKVRSNSLSTLAVVQAPTPSSTSRPAPKQSQHSQLALTHVQPSPSLHPAIISYAPQITSIPVHSPSLSSHSTPHSDQPRKSKRPRLNYQLDVGAYGIPKSHRNQTSNSYAHTALSVQVGEDAYFIRDNAMGIADGVGGWAKSANYPQSPQIPTPSALFSRRLMHFCSAELDSLALHQQLPIEPTTRPPSISKFSFTHPLKPPPPQPEPYPPIFDQLLSNSLEELSEGINVLNILEHAYNSTIKAHTNPTLPIPTPLTTGSSTALVAVLDHPPQLSEQNQQVSLYQSPSSEPNYAAGSLPSDPHPTFTASPLPFSDPASTIPSSSPSPSHTQSYDAILRIAHLGDCMGILIREDNITWRTDEMWWGYNHPLQLGPLEQPPTPSTKSSLPTQPHTFSLPVRENDILILASDGLSDNLWDDDILDEVVKFRRSYNWDTDDAVEVSFERARSRSSSPSSRSSSSSSRSSSTAPTTPDSLSASLSNLHLASSSSASPSSLRRKTFAKMLSEALCSRAKRVSERRGSRSMLRRRRPSSIPEEQPHNSQVKEEQEDEIPFARRARMSGKVFRGGKPDDISVVVAVISRIDSSSSPESMDR